MMSPSFKYLKVCVKGSLLTQHFLKFSYVNLSEHEDMATLINEFREILLSG